MLQALGSMTQGLFYARYSGYSRHLANPATTEA